MYGNKVGLIVCLASAAFAGGCAADSDRPGPQAPLAQTAIERIDYAVGPCHGTCPAYAVSIMASGGLRFAGERFTAAPTGALEVSAAVFDSIVKALAPAKPTASSRAIARENCAAYATDQQTVTVTWVSKRGERTTFAFDLGCHDSANQHLRQALHVARRLMPIDGLVGRATNF